MIDRRLAIGWVLWSAMLALSTALLLWSGGEVDQTHASLTMLLVVLGGSVAGGLIGRRTHFAGALVAGAFVAAGFAGGGVSGASYSGVSARRLIK